MLLNKIPTLDKGFVAAVSSHLSHDRLLDVSREFMSSLGVSDKLLNIAHLTLVIKCPLFVQLHLSQYGFDILPTKQSDKLEAYVPHEGEIAGKDLEVSRLISGDMLRTTEALFINPTAYQADGCDRFMSQVMTPINTYTTIIVHGSYREWQRLVTQQNLPAPIEAYRIAIKQITDVEWSNL